MLVEKDIKKLFQQLVKDDSAHVQVEAHDILVRVFDNASKLYLTTPIYKGSNYIPKSVRQSISLKAPFSTNDQIRTYLTLDEEQFHISLNYVGLLDGANNDSFKKLLEDFGWLAEQWQRHLDDNDKKDLIHVRVK